MATRRTPRSTSSPGGGASLDREKPSTSLSESSRMRSRRRAAASDSRSVSPTPTRGRQSLSNVSPSPSTSRTRRIRTPTTEPDQVASAENSDRSRTKRVSITTPSPRKSDLSASRKSIDTTTPEVTPTKQSRKRRREEDDEEQDDESTSLAAEKSDGEKSLLSAVKNSGRKLLGSLADVIAPKRPKVSAGQPHPDPAPESDSEDGNSIASSTALATEEIQLISAEKEGMATPMETGSTSSSSEFLRQNNSDELTDIQKVKRRVLGQLNGRLRPRMVGLETVYGYDCHLIEQTILAPIHAAAMAKPDANTSASAASISLASFHGGNSALLLGPRGSGKSLVIDSVLADLHRKYRGHFITVRLSGLAQTDDKLALHEIALQIERGRRGIEEGETADGGRRVYRRQSANRTLSRLVTMLSGRSGLEEAKIDNDDERDDEDDDDNGAVVSVVIILDEFERFATMQNRQTLLYNLLDAAQSPRYSATSSGKTRAPSMCIIGMSSRMTAPEMLEKRVRSRFSHRVVLIPHPSEVEKFWSICEAAATLESGKAASVSDEVAQTWNTEVQKLSKAPSVQRLIRRVFATTRDPRQVHVQLAMCVRGCTDALSLSAELVTRLDLGATEGAGAMERVAGKKAVRLTAGHLFF
ncbi:hypothetical protein BZA70DRAFT_272507 [Myxozyma melibiosi]|uniref:Origin recognition complex subunit 4 n=1 Tax=Myxozyma melibiosi TaxID=54550 RepID=A0ABR1FDI7_9ASCO